MTMKNSEYPWDVRILKEGKKLFIDKHDNEKEENKYSFLEV